MNPADENPHERLEAKTGSAPLTSHSYDGIQEYDNPMPAWWRRAFWASFVFSLGYFVHFQLTGNGASVEQSYSEDMREFRELRAAQSLGEKVTEEGLARLMNDPQLIADARTVFVARCVQCHADRGQGNIGPNLTDDYWLNGGGKLEELYEIVTNGRTQKGMPDWGLKLRPLELAQVVAYVGTLRHTNLPGKPPQGSKVAPEASATGAPPAAAPVPTSVAPSGAAGPSAVTGL
ncbi:MAG TPA: cbb3-type cytochrome c oxidase N-terminal domain-containing protein [Polyangiaceae bacterium]|nr:cbb3-type cytochrome c oxidase N-terminal domain-containing protein [Polyangiaceae bacterium]